MGVSVVENKMKPRVFVSYTTRDGTITKNYLINLEKELSKYFDVFIDMLHNDSVNSQHRVIDELMGSDVILLINTSHILKSPWVRFELSLAISNNKPILIFNPYDV